MGSGSEDGDPPEGARIGRFHVPHRDGTSVEVGEPVRLGGDRPWMCAVKLVGHRRDGSSEGEPTQTLLVRTGRGESPEDARRDALAQLTVVYGSPVEPPPEPVIVQKPSDPPGPEARAAADLSNADFLASADPGKNGWIARVGRAVARLLRT